MQGTKKCPKCQEILCVSFFQKNKSAKDGLQYHCKACRKEIDSRPEHRAQHRKRYHTQKDQYRDDTYKRKYGITLEEYNKMLADQKNVCAICGLFCTTKRNLAVDHDHDTGEVRGLLCSNCNRGLGHFQDKVNNLEKAIEYLKKYEKERKFGD